MDAKRLDKRTKDVKPDGDVSIPVLTALLPLHAILWDDLL